MLKVLKLKQQNEACASFKKVFVIVVCCHYSAVFKSLHASTVKCLKICDLGYVDDDIFTRLKVKSF